MKPQPRVCDLALALIEFHGKVRFHDDMAHGTYLHQLPDAERVMVVEGVSAWWSEAKDKSVAAGVRMQLVMGRSNFEKIWMAKTLARLGKGQPTDDREFALEFLRVMVEQNRRDHRGVSAANALAEFGDITALDIFYDDWKSRLGMPGVVHDRGIAFYLCKHGGRREWELLHQISLEEVANRDERRRWAIWSSIANSSAAGKNPYAIPILGLALDQVENRSRSPEQNAPQPSKSAYRACERLQEHAGMDFGYQEDRALEQRLAALKKAQAWWHAEGKEKYTFDYMEKNMPRPNARHRRKSQPNDGQR